MYAVYISVSCYVQAVVVTDQDIRRQEMRVKEAQKGLEAALQALRA